MPLSIEFTRHNPNQPFSFDEVKITAYVDDDLGIPATLEAIMRAVDPIMPPKGQDDVKVNPAQQSLPMAQQPYMPPTHTSMPPAAGMSLEMAERVLSPCGESNGQPLHVCEDKDLQYLSTRYKKDANVKQAAAIVLAARQMGQTTRHM